MCNISYQIHHATASANSIIYNQNKMQKITLSNHAIIGVSDKFDGNMRVFTNIDERTIIDNQTKLANTIALPPYKVARVHVDYDHRDNFTVYQEITQNNIEPYSIINPEPQIPLADGFITRDSNIGFLLPLADCLGIVVLDETKHIIGLVHAGRHNVEQDGPKKFIEYFITKFNSQADTLKIYFSPCAQNYEIFSLDHQKLPIIAKNQLISAGVLPNNIIESKIDTATNPDYPSNSSGDTTLRFAIATRMID